MPFATVSSSDRSSVARSRVPVGLHVIGVRLILRRRTFPIALDPSFAHAYYYAGLSRYRANRPDLMAARFERFLKLAPDAPERTEVQQIMRTIRGR